MLFLYDVQTATALIADAALVFQIIHNDGRRGDAQAAALILTFCRTDSHRIAVRNDMVGVLQVQLTAVFVKKCQFLNLTICGILHDVAGNATDIGETLFVIVIAGYEHRSQFLTRDMKFQQVVLEGIHLHHVTHDKIAGRMILNAYATRGLVGDVGTCLCDVGITNHTSQLFITVERCFCNGEDTLESRVLAEVLHQFCNGLVGT